MPEPRSPMHVVILNQTFYPEVAATAQLMWDLARHLDAAGHRVTAICSRHIYGTDQSHAQPFERIGKVEIRRVGGTRFGKRKLAGRLSDFLSFYAMAMLELQRIEPPDVILALSSPPMISLLAALQRAFSLRADGGPIRLVYHVMDLYPDAANAMGVLRRGSVIDRIMEAFTGYTLHASDRVIALGRDMRDLILDRYRCRGRANRIAVIPPWSDGAQLRPMDKAQSPLAREWGITDTFNVVYSGNLGMAHDVETMVGAMERLKEDAGIQWLFIGAGNRFKALQEHAAQAGWKNVRFLPYQERESLNDSLNVADVHLVTQLPEFTGIVVPSKLYGIMAVGRPAVMVGPPEAECSRTISEHETGFVVGIGDVDALVARLLQLRGNPDLRAAMGQRARAVFERLYDRPIACRRIQGIFEHLMEAS